jgi:stress response protein YsnF
MPPGAPSRSKVSPADFFVGPHRPTVAGEGEGEDDRQVLELHAEKASVIKRVRRTLVRVARTTQSRDAIVEENLTRESVVIERVPINRVVDAAPPIRQEGDVTIMSLVEEVVVVERRLVLKEELHLRRVRSVERHSETVALREQHAAVTRTELDD